MKRKLISVINALICSLLVATTGVAEAVHFPGSTMTSQQLHSLLAAKQLLTVRRKITTTTTKTETEEYEVSVDDRPHLSDRLEPELKTFLAELKAEHDREVEITLANDVRQLFELKPEFNQYGFDEYEQKVKHFMEHFAIKINGKEIPYDAVEKIRIRGNAPITFSLEIKNNKLLSLGTFFSNAVATVADKIKALCLKVVDPLSLQFTYPCRIQEQKLRSNEPISIATLMYKHPPMAAILDGNPHYSMLSYINWPTLRTLEFRLPEFYLEETT